MKFVLALVLLVLPLSAQEPMVVRVYFKEMLLKVSDQSGNVTHTFPVALPMIPLPLPVRGKVAKVELNATWYPTPRTREAYFKNKGKELPKVIPPGHPLNAMGAGDVVIVFESPKVNPLIRIHGTNDPKSISRRITRGCIRLKNEDFLKLAEAIKGRETNVVFE